MKIGASGITLPVRLYLYLLWILVVFLLFLPALSVFWHLALTNEDFSHLPVIPIISAALLLQERKNILHSPATDYATGTVCLAVTALLWLWVRIDSLAWDSTDRLAVLTLALIFALVAGFAYCFGRGATRAAKFPLLFLLFAVPLPHFVLDRIISFLQHGSAEFSAVFFELTGVPVLREGLVFHLSAVDIEVARECSGIRSSIALLILAVLVGHFLLKGVWRNLVFIAVGIAVMLVKNSIRIVTLTLLANYVDPGFLFGRLHREGGVVFFLIGLVLIWPVLRLLQRSQTNEKRAASSVSA